MEVSINVCLNIYEHLFLCLFYKNELKKTKWHCESIGLNLSVFRSFLVPTKFRCDHNTDSALPLLFICENYL